MRRAGFIVGLFGALSLVVSGLVAPAARAQTAFPPGTGTATGRIAAVAVRSSGVAAAVTIGDAQAVYTGAQGNAQAAALDLGVLDTLFRSPIVCGKSANDTLPLDRIPQPLKVSSGGGPVDEQNRAIDNSGVAAAEQRAAAAPNSMATARVKGVATDIAGLVGVTGGEVESYTKLTPNSSRYANSRTKVGALRLAGGRVVLHDLVWDATHRTGDHAGVTSSFSVGALEISGVSVPVATAPQLAAALKIVNNLLKPVGLTIASPTETKTKDEIEMTPLRITFSPTKQMLTLVAPILKNIQPARTRILEAVTPLQLGEDCGLKNAVGTAYLIADLVGLALGSGGGVDILIGGVKVGTDARSFANPFGGASRPPALGLPGAPLPVAVVGGVVTVPREAVELAVPATSRTRCRTVHPFGSPGCSNGSGVLAGWSALAVTLGLVAVERVRARRRSREGDVS